MQAISSRPDKCEFPAIYRSCVDTLQVNLGYRCNQSCSHCHVSAGPSRSEVMQPDVVEDVVDFLKGRAIKTLDLTGGAPEMHPAFRSLVSSARLIGVEVIDRCNLTILTESGYESLPEFLAANRVRVIASLPCYGADTVDKQRGAGTYDKSLRALRALNQLGYGQRDTGLVLDLVYNPADPALPPPERELEHLYRGELSARHGITFTRLLAVANMPIGRFARELRSSGRMRAYLALLRSSHRDENLERTMCRHTLSVDWRGFAYDCDFNQILRLPLAVAGRRRSHLRELLHANLESVEVRVAEHCYGCTAGQGSGCTGALSSHLPNSPRLSRCPAQTTHLLSESQ